MTLELKPLVITSLDYLKGDKCNYNGCGKKFYHKANFEKHMRIHTEEKPYKCNRCSMKFRHSHTLTSHINSIHLKLRPYKCNYCDHACGENSDLKKHINFVHKKIKKYECQYCNKRFTTKSHKTEHERIHTGEKPYHCERCNKAFAQSSGLRKHKC